VQLLSQKRKLSISLKYHALIVSLGTTYLINVDCLKIFLCSPLCSGSAVKWQQVHHQQFYSLILNGFNDIKAESSFLFVSVMPLQHMLANNACSFFLSEHPNNLLHVYKKAQQVCNGTYVGQ